MQGHGLASIVLGDFQMNWEDEILLTGWAQRLRLRRLVPQGDMPTYVQGEAATCIDHILLSEQLADPEAQAQVMLMTNVKCHRPVQATLCVAEQHYQRVIQIVPRSFPAEVPVGARRRPPQYHEHLAATWDKARGLYLQPGAQPPAEHQYKQGEGAGLLREAIEI